MVRAPVYVSVQMSLHAHLSTENFSKWKNENLDYMNFQSIFTATINNRHTGMQTTSLPFNWLRKMRIKAIAVLVTVYGRKVVALDKMNIGVHLSVAWTSALVCASVIFARARTDQPNKFANTNTFLLIRFHCLSVIYLLLKA